MAANRCYPPTPGTPEDPDHTKCPICAWSPCLKDCPLEITAGDLELFESYFFEPPADWGNPSWVPGQEDEDDE